ncbi:heavy-metal-associated domain-containing protein [Tamlana crocina]
MSLLSENVIPGNHGKIFGTDAKEMSDLLKIEKVLLQIDGIKDVILNKDVYPREFTIHTTKLIRVEQIENMVKKTGFHVVPKSIFKL